MDTSLMVDVVGWAGAVLLLIAYGLVSLRGYKGTSAAFQWLNVAGGALLIVNSAYYGAYPSAFLNVVWIGIAVAAIARARRPDKPSEA
jgi:hypothetical protein